MQTSERTTKAGQIERTSCLTMWSNIITAIVTETKQLKTKTTSTSTSYTLKKIDSDFGIGVEIQKHGADATVYHVNLSEALGDSCSCPWGSWTRGKPCRHLELCHEARERGLI